MSGRDETLRNLYSIRAGLSLLSGMKDELDRLKPVPEKIRKRIPVEKALSEVYSGPDKYGVWFAKPTGCFDYSYVTGTPREVAIHYAARLKPLCESYYLIEEVLDTTYGYTHGNGVNAPPEEYSDSYFKHSGVCKLFDSLIDYIYNPKYTGDNPRKLAKEEKRKNKFRNEIVTGLLKGNSRTYLELRDYVKYEIYQIRHEEHYAVYYNYKKPLLDEREKLKGDGYQEYIDKLTEKHGSLEKALSSTERTINVKTNTAVAVYNVLYGAFNDFLPVSHWKNIDALIYYITERYADTVKEALNLLLQQQQNDRLVNAISDMEKKITDTVNRGISSLKNQMNAGFDNLSDQLDGIYRQQTIANAQLTRANHAIDLNNVLRMKANLTSERLADDMSYFRSLAQG